MPPLNLPGYVQGDQRTANGDSLITTDGAPVIPPPPPAVLLSGSGYQFIAAFSSGALEDSGVFPDSVTATFNATGQLTAQNGPNSYSTALLPGGSHAEFSTDGILAWGRWIGNVQMNSAGSTENFPGEQGYHYVVGIPTAVMPTSGGPWTYTLAGATSPTYGNGGTLPGSFSGTLSVTFAGTATVDAAFNITMPDATYGVTGRAVTSSATFGFVPVVTNCSSACGQVSGFFAGTSAERAGVGYWIQDSTGGRQIFGAAAFSR
jgi:hypothetical protein